MQARRGTTVAITTLCTCVLAVTSIGITGCDLSQTDAGVGDALRNLPVSVNLAGFVSHDLGFTDIDEDFNNGSPPE